MLTQATNDWMMKHGFDPASLNARGRHEDTALILACRQGERTVVSDLLAAGADTALTNMDGTNALWAACVADDFTIADALLRQGIDIDHQNANGASVLMYAASSGRAVWVDYLLHAGADTRLRSLDGFTALELASTRTILQILKNAESMDVEQSKVGC